MQAVARYAPLGACAAVVAWFAVQAAGVAGAVLLAVAAGSAVALALRLRGEDAAADAAFAASVTRTGLLLVPGALVVFFSFDSGGFFAESVALGALLLAGLVIVHVALAEEPFSGAGRGLAFGAGALAAFAVWTFASAAWSDAPGRAIVEADRVLVYLLAMVAVGLIPRDGDRLRIAVRGLAAGAVVVCVAGFVSRTLPDVFPTETTFAENRLNYPASYWNAMGFIAALALVLCLHLACTTRERRLVRVAAAAALPVIAPTLLLTFSRGAIGACAIGVVVYVLVGRPRGLITGLLAAAPLAALAAKGAYDATLLAGDDPTGSAAVEQGHDLALLVLGCAAGAAILRILLLRVDNRLADFRLPPDRRRRIMTVAWGALAVAAVVGAAAVNAPGRVADRYDGFVERDLPSERGGVRDRLDDPANNGRIDHWTVSVDAFRRDELHGHGAGTYVHDWARDRPETAAALSVVDGHGLYTEVLGELGIVGLALLLAAVGAVVVAVWPGGRARDRSLYAALFAAVCVWLLQAGFDWLWEMPATTAWVFAVGGLALARSTRRAAHSRRSTSDLQRAAAGAVVVAVAVVPVLVLQSQHHIDDGVAAFLADDYPTAAAEARDARAILPLRAEPYEIAGTVALRRGEWETGVREFERAIDRDPEAWELHYGLAVALASAGRDPRAQIARTVELNPLDEFSRKLLEDFDTDDPAKWRFRGQPLGRTLNLSIRY